MRRLIAWGLLGTLGGCATTPGQPMTAAEQQAMTEGMLALFGLGLVAHQAAQQQKQVHEYNEAVIRQQQESANILGAINQNLRK